MDFPETSIKLVGKLGPRVYYYDNGIRKSRSYFIPVQPGTISQTLLWDKFRAGVLLWQSLTPVQKKLLNDIATDFNISGFNLYMSRHLKS